MFKTCLVLGLHLTWTRIIFKSQSILQVAYWNVAFVSCNFISTFYFIFIFCTKAARFLASDKDVVTLPVLSEIFDLFIFQFITKLFWYYCHTVQRMKCRIKFRRNFAVFFKVTEWVLEQGIHSGHWLSNDAFGKQSTIPRGPNYV